MSDISLGLLLLMAMTVLLGLPSLAGAWTPPGPTGRTTAKITATTTIGTRYQFLQQAMIVATATTTTLVLPIDAVARAKDDDSANKGTKKDPAFEACLSKCMYECTKPKGVEQKSRAECLPECRKSCATTKEQLMTGTPLRK